MPATSSGRWLVFCPEILWIRPVFAHLLEKPRQHLSHECTANHPRRGLTLSAGVVFVMHVLGDGHGPCARGQGGGLAGAPWEPQGRAREGSFAVFGIIPTTLLFERLNLLPGVFSLLALLICQ